MTQHMTSARARGGWSEDEASVLFERVSQAHRDGTPLRAVFDDVGRELGRKPNSIRNYYYQRVNESPALSGEKKPSFRVFTGEETRELIASVLAARGRGTSVRACVRELANGDPKQMLRYQNKYRSVLKSKPELLNEIARELSEQGLSVPAIMPLGQRAPRHVSELESAVSRYAEKVGDKKAAALIDAVTELIRSATGDASRDAWMEELEKSREQTARARAECDRLKVQVDLQKMVIEDLHGSERAEREEIL